MTRSGETRPAIFSRPKAPTSGGSALSGTALVMISIAPEKRLALASVMTKLLTPVRTMAKPFSQPSAPPSASAPAIATGTGSPSVCISVPAVITAQTPIEPTARFMPPVASTTICANPMTMSTRDLTPEH